MATPTTGTPRPLQAVGAGVAPSPGVSPTVSVPAGTDPNTAAVMFAQQYPQFANFDSWVASAVKFCPPIAPASATSAYSVVTYTSFGGTVTPSSAGATYNHHSGTSFVILCTLGGAVATAKFKMSVDGGNSFGAEQTTAASMTDATSGITLAFAGTLTLNGTAQFHSAYTPLASLADSAGNVRSIVDAFGYQMGRTCEMREDWMAHFGPITSSATITNNPKWGTIYAGTGTGIQADSVSPGSSPCNACWLYVQGTSGNKCGIYTTNFGLFMTSYVASVWEWEYYMTETGANNQTHYIGFSGSTDPTVATNYIWFRKASADTNWWCESNGGSLTQTTSGIAPVASTPQRFKLAYLGSSLTFGAATLLFFINEALVASITTNIPTGPLFFTAMCNNTGAANANSKPALLPLIGRWNRWQSVPTL